MTFGEKLKKARVAAGLKQAELAKQLNTTGNTISNWENGVSKPDLDTLSYICGILQVTASYFLQALPPEDEVNLPELKLIQKYRGLDPHGKDIVDTVLDKEHERCISPIRTDEAADSIILPFPVMPASAGAGEYLDSFPDEMIRVKTTPESRLADFALKVAGDSMEPAYSDGDTILVQRTEELEIVDVGVFIVNNEGYIKRLGEGGLESLNPDYNGVTVNDADDFRIIGKVIGKAEPV